MQSAHGTIVFFNMFLLQNNKFISDLRLRGIPQKENKHIYIYIYIYIHFSTHKKQKNLLVHTCFIKNSSCHNLNDFATVCVVHRDVVITKTVIIWSIAILIRKK